MGYGIGASLVVMVVGPIAAVYYTTRDTSPDLLAGGTLCRKPGIRYIGETPQGVRVCFTLTPDRSTLVELGWRFVRGSGDCRGGATYSDYEYMLASPGRITEPGFTATIRGAHASGVLKDSDVCPGKTFEWNARREP